MTHSLKLYPEKGKSLYFLEYSQWEGSPKTWTLFRREYLPIPDFLTGKPRTEVHPYNLGGGEVNEADNVVSLNTPKMLEYIVDALNEKAGDAGMKKAAEICDNSLQPMGPYFKTLILSQINFNNSKPMTDEEAKMANESLLNEFR